MPLRPIGDVPPDHPMFHGGVSFVFRSHPPEEHDESEHDDAEEQQPERD